jgi:protein-L-isoaspartate(D-aspartate) O-methyltransferase
MASEAEATAEFLLRLRAQGIRNLALLRALEAVPRRNFAPHRYADLAGRDVALPIGCGQTMSEPSLVANMIEGLELDSAHRTLEVGTGTGYCTAILSRMSAAVVSLERFRTLVLEAQARLVAMAAGNVSVVWADALAAESSLGTFQRILIHGALAAPPHALLERLQAGGIMIFARAAVRAGGQRLVQLRRADDSKWSEKELGPARLGRLIAGLAQQL